MRALHTTRRNFIKIIGLASFLIAIPITACKHIFKKDKLELTDKNIETLDAVLLHLLPSNQTPGAIEAKTSQYLQSFILQDKYLKASKKSILISGLYWLEDEAGSLYNKSFSVLSFEQKEATLRKIEGYAKGRRWLSYLLTYSFESLLGDPVYNINSNKSG